MIDQDPVEEADEEIIVSAQVVGMEQDAFAVENLLMHRLDSCKVLFLVSSVVSQMGLDLHCLVKQVHVHQGKLRSQEGQTFVNHRRN